jgi:integrase
MAKRKGIIFATLERLKDLTAYHESRFQAKEAARASGEYTWAFTTGKIHSTTTRTVYQQHTLAFINWARATHGIHRLEQLDSRADELATQYFTEHIAAARSAYTIQTERAALRMFFSDRNLASSIVLPERSREQIHRSRGPAAQDKEFQPLNWQREIKFLQACGLRRMEALRLLVKEVRCDAQGIPRQVYVAQGKGGKERTVPILPGREQDVLAVIRGRDPEEAAVARLPVRLDVHCLRREYAQAFYRLLSGRELPPPSGRLSPDEYDEQAVLEVSGYLGHNRKDVILRHYLR